jgi:hypothetical protein
MSGKQGVKLAKKASLLLISAVDKMFQYKLNTARKTRIFAFIINNQNS